MSGWVIRCYPFGNPRQIVSTSYWKWNSLILNEPSAWHYPPILTDSLKMDYLFQIACVQPPLPLGKNRRRDVCRWGGRGTTVPRLSETDNPSSNCPSKLAGKVRRIVHSKLKPFHFQIKTYYLSDANYQTDNPSHPNNPPLVWKRPFLL